MTAEREPIEATPEGGAQGTVSHASGIPAAHLDEEDLVRELAHLHATRHETFLHASGDALAAHTRRTSELEDEYVRRHPERHVDPERLRSGARGRTGQS